MTEAEWLASEDPAVMGEAVLKKKRATARVLRLYLAAFWDWQSHRLETDEGRKQLKKRAAVVAQWAETGKPTGEATEKYTSLVFFNFSARDGFLSTVRAPAGWKKGKPAIQRAVELLREIFGNPFAPAKKRKGETRRGWMFSASWRTDTAVQLARQMYESCEFSAMPILADALQDAGCDNEDILNHCRESIHAPKKRSRKKDAPPAHVRGCWVLDLVLEKT